jgi:hypothetical protein
MRQVHRHVACAARGHLCPHAFFGLRGLAKIGKPKAPDAEKVEDELQQTVEALRDAFTELSERIHAVAVAAQVVTARVTIALILSALSLLLSIACWLFLLFHY